MGVGFTLYDELKLRLEPAGQPLGFGSRLLAGSMSGVMAQSLTYPVDTVRRRMQV